jgi:HNH endonuclease/AP2 domain
VAGSPNESGYVSFMIDGRRYLAHRLARFWLRGEWTPPHLEIDHINGNKADNRLCNLRHCKPSQNRMNRGVPAHNTSGKKGVSFRKERGKWRAEIHISGKKRHLGYFETAELAHAAYYKAATEHYGKFARMVQYCEPRKIFT